MSLVMRKFRLPWIWLRRFRKRRGYGVHSPFAYQFLQQVVFERLPFYAQKGLDKKLNWCEKARKKKVCHLLFRLSNYVQPESLYMPQGAGMEYEYLQAGCKRAQLQTALKHKGKTLCLLKSPDEDVCKYLDEESVLVLDNLHRHKKWFATLPAIVTFDLYDIGIAFFNPKHNKQHYIINF